ncbi:hypothetical protein EUTSA_v10020655mg [Eutrema salsugineum]|uniref:Uncharacterized protein n=1 Tax=Eutrema salsugineum TaxID=72664 RepID=V4LX14_EUTSA|nr:hypothetical protein EUTSA_v10020655mg [Eutrema salsugineum]
MMRSMDAGGEEIPDFKWGVKTGVGRADKNVHFYESFTYKGIDYQLFDCACFQVFLGGYEPRWDELYLACGDGPGVYNINDVEAILGKCNVLCVSNDRRNPQPARSELRNANYVFSRTFNTRLNIVSEDFTDAIAGIRVENFFNKIRDKPPLKRLNPSAATGSWPSPVKPSRLESRSTELRNNDNKDGKQTSRISMVKKDVVLKDRVVHVPVKKNPPLYTDITSRCLEIKTRALGNSLASNSSLDSKPATKRKLRLSTPERDDSGPEPGESRFIKMPPLVDKAPTQNIGKSSWYKKLPFEDELKEATENDRVILFENLEPSYSSLEVEYICRQAFNERVGARMIPASPVSNPHYGRALVIFQTTKSADNAMSRLAEGCLMLSDETRERPLVGSRYGPKEVDECRRFTGHLGLLDKAHMSFEKAKKSRCYITLRAAQPHCIRDGVCHLSNRKPKAHVKLLKYNKLALLFSFNQ